MNWPMLVPRTEEGLGGVVFAPLTHLSWVHVALNLLTFAYVAWCLRKESRGSVLGAALFITLAGGLLTWMFGRYGVHEGASGLILGLFFLHTCRKSLHDAIVCTAFLVLAVVLDSQLASNSSWEMHLFGALAGVLYAAWGPSKQGARYAL